MDGGLRGASSSGGFPVETPGPRRLPSQSFTHSGTVPDAKATLPSARIHISASECLHGNLRLGHVHL